MASVTQTHKQFVVKCRFRGQQFTKSFPLACEEEAMAYKAHMDAEVARCRRSGGTPVFATAPSASVGVDRQSQRSGKRVSATKLLEDFVATNKGDWRSPHTESSYRHSWNSFCTNADISYSSDITPKAIQWYKSNAKTIRTKEPLTNTSVHNNLKRIFVILNFAYREKLIAFEPAELHNIRLDEAPNPFLTKDELKHLAFVLEQTAFDVAAVFYLGMFAGLRKNEILNARWNWIHPLEKLKEYPDHLSLMNGIRFLSEHSGVMPSDFIRTDKLRASGMDEERIEKILSVLSDGKVEHTSVQSAFGSGLVIRVGNHHAFRTKSGKFRTIPLHMELLEFLAPLSCLVEDPNEYIVRPDLKGGTAAYRWDFRKAFKRVLKKAGLETVNRYGEQQPVTPHVLRYTFCSMLAQSGEFTAYDIMKYAGHADLKTAERYMWLAPERVSLRF